MPYQTIARHNERGAPAYMREVGTTHKGNRTTRITHAKQRQIPKAALHKSQEREVMRHEPER